MSPRSRTSFYLYQSQAGTEDGRAFGAVHRPHASEISLDGFDSQGFEASCREALARGKTVVRVFAYQTKTYSTRIIPEFSPDGSVESVMTISEDVSERIQAEKNCWT